LQYIGISDSHFQQIYFAICPFTKKHHHWKAVLTALIILKTGFPAHPTMAGVCHTPPKKHQAISEQNNEIQQKEHL